MADAGILELQEGAEPATPASGYGILYIDQVDGHVKHKDDLGVVTDLDTISVGTVTSVALAAPPEFTITGSPVTSSGTLTLTKAVQNANLIYAGPTTGSPATPSFRSLVSDDIPNLDFSKITTGLIPVARGGTNSSTALNNNRIMQSFGGAIVEANAITSSRALESDANGIPTHSAVTSTELGYVSGVTSAIQTQINNKQPLDAELTALAGVSSDGILTKTAAGAITTRTIQSGAGISVANGSGISGDPVISSTITQYTDELAQDAIGGALLATVSVNPTYNDGANQFSWDVLPAGVNHNSLLNYVADQHVAHTSVSITGTTNGGLGGGGNITTNRTLNLDYTNLASMVPTTDRLAPTDTIAVYDISATTHKNISLRDFLIQRRSFIDQGYVEADDFVRDSLGSLVAAGAGTANSTQAGTYGQDATENAIGISQSDTGTTSTGRRAVTSGLSSLMGTLSRYRFGARIAIEQLSNGTDTFTAHIGFQDTTASGNPTNGAWFRYTHGTNSGKWEYVTNKTGGALTAADTGVTAVTTYSIFEVEIAQDGASVKYYIDGTLVGTATTNIPTSVSNQTFGYGWKIEKSVGTAAANMSTDWYYFEHARSSAR